MEPQYKHILHQTLSKDRDYSCKGCSVSHTDAHYLPSTATAEASTSNVTSHRRAFLLFHILYVCLYTINRASTWSPGISCFPAERREASVCGEPGVILPTVWCNASA